MWQQMFKQVFPFNRGIKKQYVLSKILSCTLNPRILILLSKQGKSEQLSWYQRSYIGGKSHIIYQTNQIQSIYVHFPMYSVLLFDMSVRKKMKIHINPKTEYTLSFKMQFQKYI